MFILVIWRWLLWMVFYSSSLLGCFYGLRLRISFMWLVPGRREKDVRVETPDGLNGFLVRFSPNPYCFIHRANSLPWVVSAATLFEFVLFGMAVYKTVVSYTAKVRVNGHRSLSAILLHENIVYFFVWVFCIALKDACMGSRKLNVRIFSHLVWRVFWCLITSWSWCVLCAYWHYASSARHGSHFLALGQFISYLLLDTFSHSFSYLIPYTKMPTDAWLARSTPRWESRLPVCSSISGNLLRRIWQEAERCHFRTLSRRRIRRNFRAVQTLHSSTKPGHLALNAHLDFGWLRSGI